MGLPQSMRRQAMQRIRNTMTDEDWAALVAEVRLRIDEAM